MNKGVDVRCFKIDFTTKKCIEMIVGGEFCKTPLAVEESDEVFF